MIKARSSGGERYLDTVEVGGSKPPVPTFYNCGNNLVWTNIPFVPKDLVQTAISRFVTTYQF